MQESLLKAAWQRARLLLLGQFLGWAFTTVAALLLSGPSFDGFGYAWGIVAAGPLSGIGASFPTCGIPTPFWRLTALLIPAHPISPNRWTGALTLFGLAGWYFQGFVSALVCYLV